MSTETKTKGISEFINDPDNIAQGFLNSEFVYDPGGKGLEGGAYTLRSWRNEFYQWQNGCWERYPDAEIKLRLVEHIQQLNDGIDSEQRISVGTQRINSTLLCLAARVRLDMAVELNTWHDGRQKLIHTIAVNNGLLMFDKDKTILTKHTPNYFGLTKLPYDYDPQAQCPEWIEFLDEVLQGKTDYLLLLQQWAGYLLRPDLKEHKFLLCVGEGSNGKTVFFDVIEALIGEVNCSHVGLSQLHRPFVLYMTLGKAVNLTTESNKLIEDEGENILKTLVSGDRTDFERKFKDPVSVKPTAKFMFATNARPRFNDKTMGIWRRILLVPFNKVIADEAQNPDLAKQLKRELPGILNWAIEGLKRLNKQRFVIPKNNKVLLEEYRKDADPARAFLLENYTTSLDGEETLCKEAFGAYVEYCDLNKYRPVSDRTFGQQVKRIFPDTIHGRRGTGSREYVYRGLILQEENGLTS